MEVQNALRNRESRLRPHVRRTLPVLPPVHEQQRAIWLVVRLLELEADERVCISRDFQLEGRHEEPDASSTTR